MKKLLIIPLILLFNTLFCQIPISIQTESGRITRVYTDLGDLDSIIFTKAIYCKEYEIECEHHLILKEGYYMFSTFENKRMCSFTVSKKNSKLEYIDKRLYFVIKNE